MRGVCAVALLVSSANLARVQQALGQEADAPVMTVMNSIPVAQDEPASVPKKRVKTDTYAAVGIDAGGLRLFPLLEIGTVLSRKLLRKKPVRYFKTRTKIQFKNYSQNLKIVLNIIYINSK